MSIEENSDELKKQLDELDKKLSDLEAEQSEIEKEGIKDTLRYFDRIHDKLFTFNNMLIVSYFVLIALPTSKTSAWYILIPVINMLYLIFIDYRLMERSRFQSVIKGKNSNEINDAMNKMVKTNSHSLRAIIITLIVSQSFYINY